MGLWSSWWSRWVLVGRGGSWWVVVSWCRGVEVSWWSWLFCRLGRLGIGDLHRHAFLNRLADDTACRPCIFSPDIQSSATIRCIGSPAAWPQKFPHFPFASQHPQTRSARTALSTRPTCGLARDKGCCILNKRSRGLYSLSVAAGYDTSSP